MFNMSFGALIGAQAVWSATYGENTMKTLVLTAAATLFFSFSARAASDVSTPPVGSPAGQQQQRQLECNNAASGMPIAERNAYISGCLKNGIHPKGTPTTLKVQQKIKDCSDKANGMSDESRKVFMNTCVKS